MEGEPESALSLSAGTSRPSVLTAKRREPVSTLDTKVPIRATPA